MKIGDSGAAARHPRRPAFHRAAAALSPKPRLVKALEEYGIGRPSTYASIIQVLLNREYVILDSRRFKPTDVGRAVAKFLSGHFTQYVDYDFTAKLEDELDAVSRGEEDWVPLLEKFWKPFKAQVDEKNETVDRTEATGARELGTDPKSRQAGLGAPRPLRAVRADRHQGRRGQAEVRVACAPARACTRSRWPTRWSCSSCRASSARPTTARTSRSASAASARSSSTAATYASLQAERRSVHDRAAARARTDPREGRSRARTASSRTSATACRC